MNQLSSWSIRNPVPTVVLFVVLTVAGLFGFTGLRTNNFPDIDIPTVTVSVAQPGAAPTEIETQISTLVENAVATLEGVDDVSSSLSEGSSSTTIQFDIGINLDRATNDVRNAVSRIQSDLPANAATPVIERVNATGNAVVTFAIDGPAMNPEELSWYVDDELAKQLLGLAGVSKVDRIGGVDRAVLLALNPDRMAALGVSAADISQTLASVNVNRPGGRTTMGQQEHSIRTIGSVTTVEDLADARIQLGAGREVRLADLGTVKDHWSEPRQRARLDGAEVIAFSVYRSTSSSELDMVKAVRDKVAEIDAARDDLKFREVTTSSDFVEESYHAAREALLIGGALAIVVVWLFLRDVRATLVASVALPLSLIPTFAVMWWFDLSLNYITLLALSLVVGILVDDAIVEIENIVRHMRESGKRAYAAAMQAADEIGLAVVATTATLIAVFLPVAFMPGIPGKIFASFAVATCVSVGFSLAVARMLTPLMGAYLIKAGNRRDDTSFWVPSYLRLLKVALAHRWLATFAGIAFFGGSILLATQLPTEFLPATDRGRSILTVELPEGSTLAQTDAVVQEVTRRLGTEQEAASIFAAIGTPTSAGGGPGSSASAGQVRTATVTVNLVPRGSREASQQEFEAMVGPKLADIPGARIQFGGDGQSGAKVSVTLVGTDEAALTQASNALVEEMKTIPGVLNPVSSSGAGRPEVIIRPDNARAAEIGVTPAQIAETINVATLGDTGRSLAKFNLGDRQVSIIVSLPEGSLADPGVLATLPVAGTGVVVPLGSVAEIGFGAGPGSIRRVGRNRSSTVEADLSGVALGEAMERVRALPTMQDLPDGVSTLERGDAARLQELVSGFVLAIVSGVGLVYLTLVLLFRGFLQPITILVALPLSIGGALGCLYITGHALGVTALIGLLLLMGIAAKNSILLVEYALVAEKERGMSRIDALLGAARLRARPIVMTSIAMGAGMLPIALGFGADAESRAPMAIAVLGGLISSTALSLIYVPVLYTIMHDLNRLLARLGAKLLVNDSGGSPSDAAHTSVTGHVPPAHASAVQADRIL